ncbi:hypothetical protein P3X46_028148 [Hevea brasiliensis]|uniref:Protein kinase domain-containing protein n=1 Tax=Hevea brasiliensis TaxID=3981 RepID=A0ABQ9KPG0_HEVBR|nr:wall-associated receptor kinase 2 [Hevea brasiliensis]KAJ9145814.1 hypothetical protein P3X46_028148 [Hevea brasiliensis]
MGLYHQAAFAVGFLLLLVMVASPPPTYQTKPGCLNSCGNVGIPYPFGLQKDCYFDDSFFISCNDSNLPVLPANNTSVLDISIDGQLRVLSPITSGCLGYQNYTQVKTFNFSPFVVSNTTNKFTVVGCDSFAVLAASDYQTASCYGLCDNITQLTNGSCSGKGCCQSSIPNGVKDFLIVTSSVFNHTFVSDFNRCTYAFVAEEGTYNFSSLDLLNLQREFPLVLEWSIGNATCEEAQQNRETYACKEDSECYETDNVGGYRCNCSSGYRGNPYLSDGCQDINECEYPELNQCIEKNSCRNTEGNYTCSCPKGSHGDGRKDGQRCTATRNRLPLMIILGIIIGLLILFLVISWLYFGFRKRRVIKLREKYFKENGGYLLQQKFSDQEGNSIKPAQILTEKELKKATNNFHESRILGKGGQGTVYKGTLPDIQTVAIKKAKKGDETQVEGFINEVTILSQINHRNVVRLLGCCLETPVPLLVYEFVTNGTLFDHIHNVDKLIPWETRLKIATEVADALSYMHSAASIPIIHRDIKSANILLDDKYTAKVSDFGASKLIPLDKSELTTLVQGTLGYLDPEYMQTSQLTEKSDVYSFGVVLVELLTRKRAISFTRLEEERNLALHFVTSLQKNQLFEIIDHQLQTNKNTEQLKAVAMLAKSCLSVKGEERPTMKEVAIELQGLCSIEKHLWGKDNLCAQEYESLLGKPFDDSANGSTSLTIKENSIEKSVTFEIETGR